jgi:hypothetical protein
MCVLMGVSFGVLRKSLADITYSGQSVKAWRGA